MMLLQSNMALGLKEQIQGISADIAWLAPEITLVKMSVPYSNAFGNSSRAIEWMAEMDVNERIV